VRPSPGTVGDLRVSSSTARNMQGDYLDRGHDWLYRRMQYLIEDLDSWFANPGLSPLPVPVSPLRFYFDSVVLHRQDQFGFTSARALDATLGIPNLERRLKLFITSDSLQERPTDPASQQNPLRAGLRVIPGSDVDIEVGVRAKILPSAFGAVRWARTWSAGSVRAYPFAKLYVETGTGFGASGGIAVERWSNRWVLRSATYADWVRNTAATNWTQTFIAGYARAIIQERSYDRLADGHDLACGVVGKVLMSGDRSSRTMVYETNVHFKMPLHGGWLFGYAGPVVRWERIYGWHADIGVRRGFDALFWGLATGRSAGASSCKGI